MSKASIWAYLRRNTALTEESIAGIMGNMEAESNCESMRLQGDFTADRRLSREYADKVNSAAKGFDFIYDSKGWGLCQWTYNSRKLNLLNSCRSQSRGIADEEAQLVFMLAEMQTEYPTMWKELLYCHDIAKAAYLVVHNYERPAVENTNERTAYAQDIYNEFHGTGTAPAPAPAIDYRLRWIEYLNAERDRISTLISELEAATP